MKKKIVLIGDSIRQAGYGLIINQYLEPDKYEIWQSVDNDRYVKFTLRKLWDERENIKNADVVHWNNGLWDTAKMNDGKLFTSLEEYKENILRVADILLANSKKVIFATTTPVREKHPDNNINDIRKYNEEIVPLLKEKGIIINDLFTLVNSDIDNNICDD